MHIEKDHTMIQSHIRPAVVLLLALTILTGGLYPLLMTGTAGILFPNKSAGSMIVHEGRMQGSELIGQSFQSRQYFWSRPSSTAPYPYNAAASVGSNLGPLNPQLLDLVHLRVNALQESDPGNRMPVPVDLVTASGSGLDPNISIAAAEYQIHRVASCRHCSEEQVRVLLARFTEDRQFGFLGEPRVNVVLLNLALDHTYPINIEGK
jgi:potassium-transporting ATPase KdpC subunit